MGLVDEIAYSKHKLVGDKRISFDEVDDSTKELIRSKNILDQEIDAGRRG